MRNLLHNFSLFSFLFFAFNLISPNNGAPVAGRRTIEGDIVGESIKTLKVAGDKAKAKANLLWPNATVPYLLFTEYSDWQKKQIETAIKGFDVTCVRFVPRTTEDDYLLISPGARECSAEIGNKRNGVQIVSLVPDCIQQLGTIQHELMHSLGFYHEQARSDRDNYVDISWDHIREDGKDQFFSYNFNTDDYPYDFGSVMHYDKFAFSRNSERNYWTLRPQPKYVKQAAQDSPTGEIGQRAGLSPKDIQKIRAMYKCDEKKVTVEEKPADTAGATMEPAKAETEMTTKPKPSKIQATTRIAALVTAAQTSSAYDYEDDVSSGATVTSEIPEIKTTRAGRKKTTTEAKNVVDTTILSTTEATRTVPQTATTPSHEDSTTTPPSDYEDEPTSAETVTTKMVEAKTTRKMRRTTVFNDAASETTTLTTTRAASKVTMPLVITTTEFEEYEDETTGTSLIGFDTTKLFYRDPNAPIESNMPNFSNPDAFTFELLSGSSLPIGKTLWNNDTRNVKFELRSDGNAVLVRLCDDTVIWSTGTATTPDLAAHSVEMQTNGNLVIRSSLGVQIWSSDTADARFAGSSLRVTQAGALCLFKDDLCWWESGGLSLCKAPQSAQFSSGTVFMKSGSRLQLGHSLFNPRKNCRLSLHLNGDLVLRQQCDVTETWSIRHGTGKVLNLGDGSNDKVQEFVMTKEGHLVVHRPDGGEDFKIMIPNAHGADLRLSSSCHMCVFKDGSCLWTAHGKAYSCP